MATSSVNICALSETELDEVSGGHRLRHCHGHTGYSFRGINLTLNLNLAIVNVTQIAIGNQATNFSWVGINFG
jgi:hypothetical protein